MDLLSDGASVSSPINATPHETLEPLGGADAKVTVRVATTVPARSIASAGHVMAQLARLTTTAFKMVRCRNLLLASLRRISDITIPSCSCGGKIRDRPSSQT